MSAGKPVERRPWREPDELGAGRRGVARNGRDDGGERRRPVVLDVGRDLSQPAVLEPQPDRSHPGQTLGSTLADQRGDRARILERRGRCELDVERDQRRSRGDQRRARGRVRARRAVVGRQLASRDPSRELLRTAAAQLRAGPAARERAVQEHRRAQVRRRADRRAPAPRHTRLRGRRRVDRRSARRRSTPTYGCTP